VATSYNNLGLVYWDKGDLDQAISYLTKAERLYQELGNRKDELRLCLRLSDLYAKTGREAEAATSLCSGVNLLEYLRSDRDTGFRMNQALRLLDLAEKLKSELEEPKFYTCRDMIRKYQEELGPRSEGIPDSSLPCLSDSRRISRPDLHKARAHPACRR
jgi:tetratricopeptide (TPR) repeat protein